MCTISSDFDRMTIVSVLDVLTMMKSYQKQVLGLQYGY